MKSLWGAFLILAIFLGSFELILANGNQREIELRPRFSLTDFPVERGMIHQIFKTEIQQIRNGEFGIEKEVHIFISKTDIDNDGKMEYFVALQHPYFTGYQANSLVLLYKYKGKILNQIQSFGNVNLIINKDGEQNQLIVVHKKPWNTVVIGAVTWVWDGKAYQGTVNPNKLNR